MNQYSPIRSSMLNEAGEHSPLPLRGIRDDTIHINYLNKLFSNSELRMPLMVTGYDHSGG